MAKIRFENGVTVNFDGNPTPQDIEDVSKQLNLSKQQVNKEKPGFLQRFGDVAGKILKPASDFLFGSTAKTVGTVIGGLGEDIETITRPKELKQTVDPQLTQRLREQGLSDEEIKEKTLVGTEKVFSQEDVTKGDIAFTALELFPGGSVLSNYLKSVKGGAKIAEGIEAFTKTLPEKLKGQAIEQFKSVLGATTKKFKDISKKIAPELAERKVTAFSRAGLEKKATKLASESGEAISEFIENIPTTTIGTKSIIDAIEATKSKFTIKGVVVEPEKIKVADDLIAIVKEFGDELEADNIIQLRRVWDEVIDEAGKGFGLEAKETAKLKVKKVATNKIRDELAKEFPDLAKINKEFSFWNNVKKTIGETIERTSGKKSFSEQQAGRLGAGAGFIKGGIEDAVLIGVAAKNFVKLTNSTAWKTISAKKKMQLAEAIESGNAGKVAEVIKRLLLGIEG